MYSQQFKYYLFHDLLIDTNAINGDSGGRCVSELLAWCACYGADASPSYTLPGHLWESGSPIVHVQKCFRLYLPVFVFDGKL